LTGDALSRSGALWNRARLDLDSDEVLAQLLEYGEITAWRELYALARGDAELRRRLVAVVQRVPLSYGHFWLAALSALGADVDLARPLPAFRLDV
jgi:hypothetical protein